MDGRAPKAAAQARRVIGNAEGLSLVETRKFDPDARYGLPLGQVFHGWYRPTFGAPEIVDEWMWLDRPYGYRSARPAGEAGAGAVMGMRCGFWPIPADGAPPLDLIVPEEESFYYSVRNAVGEGLYMVDSPAGERGFFNPVVRFCMGEGLDGAPYPYCEVTGWTDGHEVVELLDLSFLQRRCEAELKVVALERQLAIARRDARSACSIMKTVIAVRCLPRRAAR